MTITTTFVEMVQNRAMHNIILQNIFSPLLIGGLLSLFILVLGYDKTDKWDFKLFFKAWFFCAIVLALVMIPNSVSSYRLWRDFPMQMIIDKLT